MKRCIRLDKIQRTFRTFSVSYTPLISRIPPKMDSTLQAEVLMWKCPYLIDTVDYTGDMQSASGATDLLLMLLQAANSSVGAP